MSFGAKVIKVTLPWEGSGCHAQINCSCHQVTSLSSPSPGKASGLCVPLLLPGPGAWMLQSLERPLPLTFSKTLPTGAGPPLLYSDVTVGQISVCTVWECTFKCNTPNYLFLFVPLNAFGIYFWSFLILFFFSTINLKD